MITEVSGNQRSSNITIPQLNYYRRTIIFILFIRKRRGSSSQRHGRPYDNGGPVIVMSLYRSRSSQLRFSNYLESAYFGRHERSVG